MKKSLLWIVTIAAVVSAGAAIAQTFTFSQVPAGMKKPGVYVEQDISLAAHALPSMARQVLVVGQRLGARVEPVRSQGPVLDDFHKAGTYTGTTVKKYRVKISTAGSPDQMQYSENDGATWSVASNVTTTNTSLSSGVTVSWTAATGHAAGDEWRFNAFPAASVAADVPTQIVSDGAAQSAFGQGSLAHLMARAAMNANQYVALTVVALDDNNAASYATGTVSFTNSASSAGSIRVYVGDQYVDSAIASGDTVTTIALNLANALAAKSDLPVTAQNSSGAVTLKAKNGGLAGNEIGLGYTLANVTGTTVSIAPMASGAANPVLQDALTAVYSGRYHLIAIPYNDSADVATLKAHVETVSNAVEQRGEIGIYATTGTVAAAEALAQGADSSRIAAAYVRYTAGSSQAQTPSWAVAAATASSIAGDPDVSDPIKNMALPVAVPSVTDRLSRTEQEALLAAGVGPIEVGPGNAPRLVRLPLTYTQDSNGSTVFLDFHKIAALDYMRDAAIADLSAKAPKKIVRSGNMTTVQVLRNIVLDTAFRLQEAGVLTGVENYKDLFMVQEDPANVGQMDILMPSPVVDGLYVMAVKQVLY